MTLRNEMLGVVMGDGYNRPEQRCIQIKDDEIEVVGKRGSWRREVLRRVMRDNIKLGYVRYLELVKQSVRKGTWW